MDKKSMQKIVKNLKSKTPDRVDGLGPKEVAQIRIALRRVWGWSYSRRLVVKRCETADGFAICELCRAKVAKVFVDHIEPCGDVLGGGYIQRLFVPSVKMQGLCKKCHDEKTKDERALLKLLSPAKRTKKSRVAKK